MNTIEHISLSNGFKCIHIVQIWSEGDGERERVHHSSHIFIQYTNVDWTHIRMNEYNQTLLLTHKWI